MYIFSKQLTKQQPNQTYVFLRNVRNKLINLQQQIISYEPLRNVFEPDKQKAVKQGKP